MTDDDIKKAIKEVIEWGNENEECEAHFGGFVDFDVSWYMYSVFIRCQECRSFCLVPMYGSPN